MQRELLRSVDEHQCADRCWLRGQRDRTDMHRLFVHVPAMRPEDGADRVSGQDLGMFFAITFVRVLGESHERVGSAYRLLTVHAVKAGPPQPRFTRKRLDPVAAESLFDSLAVEQN